MTIISIIRLLVDGSLPAECATLDLLKGTGDGAIDGCENSWQIFLKDAPLNGRKCDNCQPSSGQSLFMAQGLISSKEHVKAVVFGCLQEFAVLESIPTLIAGGENVMRAEAQA